MLNYIVYFSLFLSVIISGLSVLLLKISSKTLKLILSFSGAYLFAISVLHLIPEIYSGGNKSIGIYILIGFFAQILLEFTTQGIEHGHIHIHKHAEKSFPYAMMIGLSVHSFLEGMPLAEKFQETLQANQNTLLIGIILHNIPIAIALMTMLLQSQIKKQHAIALLIIFGLTAPAGTFTSNLIGQSLIGGMHDYFDKIMGVVIGIFLHISTTILFESSENHRFNFFKMLVILMGAGLALLS